MSRLALVVYGLLPAMASAQALDADTVGHPIETRNYRTLSLPFLRITPRSDILNFGEQSWGVGLTMANEIRLDSNGLKTVREDAETTRLQGTYRRGLGKGFDLTIEVPVVARGGGVLDPLILWWHQHIVDFTNTLRNDTPYGQSVVSVPGHAEFGSGAGLGDISALVTKKFGRSTLITAALKFPTGAAEKLIGSGGFDAGISGQYTYRVNSRWKVLGQLGIVFQGSATALPNSRRYVGQQAVSAMYERNSRDTIVLQWNSEDSSTVTGVADSDDFHRVTTLGFQRVLNDRQRLELFISEDGDYIQAIGKVGPDFTMGVRLTTRF